MDYIKWQKKVNADYVLPGTLYLQGQTKPYFLNCIKKYNYDLYQILYLICNYLHKYYIQSILKYMEIFILPRNYHD